MRIVVVYESSYGNTHLIASAIAEGLRSAHQVQVLPVAQARQEVIEHADLVVVGGPTHVHGMSRPATRQSAVDAAHKPDSQLTLDADAESLGLREWFESMSTVRTNAAAFDTRVDGPAIITGRASKTISRQLQSHGFHEIAEPMSFLVTKDNHLGIGQQAAARLWGQHLGTVLARSGSAVNGASG